MKVIMYLLLFLPAFVHAQTIHITTQSDSVCKGSAVSFYAIDSGVIIPHFRWQINNVNKGTDAPVFVTDSLTNGDTVTCLLLNIVGDTRLATSNIIKVSVHNKPFISPILYTDSVVCIGASITLSDTTSGGAWTSSNTNAEVSNGFVTGMSVNSGFGEGHPIITDTIFYTISDTGCTESKFAVVTIKTKPDAHFLVGFPLAQSNLCVGGSQPVYTSYDFGEETGSLFDGQIYSSNGNISYRSGYVYGLKAGTDYILGVEINVCGSDTFGTQIIVFDTFIAPFISPLLPSICVGEKVNLTDTGNGIYQIWSISNKHAAINNYGQVTGIAPGLDTVHLNVSNPCGSAGNGTSTVINILSPMGITGFDTLCIGNDVVFSDGTAGGTWSSINNGVVTIDQSGNVHVITNGNTVIDYSLGSCTVTKQITVNPPLPPITGENKICRGGTISLEDGQKKGVWYTSDPLIAVVDSTRGTVTGRENGVAAITYQLSGCSINAEVSVIQENYNLTGDYYVCMNGSTEMSGSGLGAWSTANNGIASVDLISGMVTGLNVGYATITYTIKTGCFDTIAVAVTNCVSHINVFPNPGIDEVIIEADPGLYIAYSIINAVGQEYLRQPVKTTFTEVDIRSLIKGLYFITFFGYDGNVTIKFLKE